MRAFHILGYVVVGATIAFSGAADALSSLRIGNQVLVAGDSSARVTALLGKPSHKSGSRKSRSSHASRSRSHAGGVRVITADQVPGQKWEYRRDDHVTVITIVDGRVSDIDDERI